MKPFDTLSKQGQIRRLHRMAHDVLRQYALSVDKLTCVSVRYSTIFRVDASDGQRYMLRINVPNRRTPQAIRSEMQWLDALAHKTDVSVLVPMKTRTDEWLVTVATDGIPEARHAVITSWLDGRVISKHVKPHHAHALGVAMAKLHQFSAKFTPPSGFMTTRHDNIWEWGAPTYLEADDTLLTSQQKTILRETRIRLEAFMEQLYTNPANLLYIHTDMHFNNVFYKAGKIQIFDFDDAMWGHPLQDIVVPYWWIDWYGRDTELLKAAFKSGYSSITPYPYSAEEIEYTQKVRDLYGLNFIIHYRPTIRDAVIAEACSRFEAWLEQSSFSAG